MPVQWTLILPALAGKEPQQIELAGTMKVGRASRNDILVDDGSASSSHATIEVRGDALFVRDHGSTNGTTVDGGPRLVMGEWNSVPNGASLRFGVVGTRIVGKEVADPAGGPADELADDSASTSPHHAGGEPDSAAAAARMDSDQAAVAPVAPASPRRVPRAPALEQMGARLILLDEANPRTIRLTELNHSIGRSMSVSCRIDNKLVSSEHAALSYSTSTQAFEIQDLGSSNHTVLNRETLRPNIAHRLELDSALRFGPIEAVFRVDHNVDGTRVPAAFDLQVADALILAGKLTNADVESAMVLAKESSGFLGDELLANGTASPNDWADAARSVRQFAPIMSYRAATSSGWMPKLLAFALILALGVAALYLFGSEEWVAKLPRFSGGE